MQSAVSDRVINAVPNINQNPLYYATLQAGVVGRMEMGESQATQFFGVGFDGRRFSSTININGGSAFTNGIQLDGLSVMSSEWNEATVLPNRDSLQVFASLYQQLRRGIRPRPGSGTNGYQERHKSISRGRLLPQRNEAMNANSFQNNNNAIARQGDNRSIALPFRMRYCVGLLPSRKRSGPGNGPRFLRETQTAETVGTVYSK